MDKLLIKEVVGPISIILGALIVFHIIKVMLNKICQRQISKTKNHRYKTLIALFTNIIKYFIIIISIIMILDIFGIDTKSIITSLGVVGAIAGLALQDFLKDFIAGMTIVLENQFAIGDLVEINGFRGNVTFFSLKTTRIKSWTGEEKIIANHAISEVINLSHCNSIAVVDVGVAYESDVKKVEEVLNKLCDKLSKELPNLKGRVNVLGIEDLGESAVVFRICAEVKSGEQYSTQREMRKNIKNELDKENISIPYNQLVIHNG